MKVPSPSFLALAILISCLAVGCGSRSDASESGICDESRLNCDGVCVQTQHDHNNCGQCGKVCGEDETCSDGMCRLSCGPSLSRCGSLCVDSKSDLKNCGKCGISCADGQLCENAKCIHSCSGGLKACDGACTDLNSDPKNCGSCAHACSQGQVCSASSCALTCGSASSLCGQACVDLQVNSKHCGACGNACDSGKYCIQGQCELVCEADKNKCATSCVDLQTDLLNCGTCANHCINDLPCTHGKCANLPNQIPGCLEKKADICVANCNMFYGDVPFLVVGDLNNDGFADLVVNAASLLTVALGKGDGTFHPMTAYGPTGWNGPVALADLNADGTLDIVVRDDPNAKLTLRLNNGNGAFLSSTSYTLPFDISSLKPGEFNGDGKPDLLVISKSSQSVALLLSSKTEPGKLSGPFPIPSNTAELVVGDLDNAGLDDLVAIIPGWELQLLRNTGGALSNPTPTDLVAYGGTIGDFDGDGKNEFATNGVAFARWDNDHLVHLTYMSISAQTMVAVDLNADGKDDLLSTGNFDPTKLELRISKGNFQFEPARSYAISGLLDRQHIGDLNGDHKDDIVMLGDGIRHLLNKGDGSFATPPVLPTSPGLPYGPVVADLNNDKLPDLVSSHGDSLSVWIGKGYGAFQPEALSPLTGNVADLKVADLDGDGFLDATILTKTGRLLAFLNMKNGTLSQASEPWSGDAVSFCTKMNLADFDADGRPDIVLESSSKLSILRNQGGMVFLPEAVNYTTTLLDAADLDGDGAAEIVGMNQGLVVLFNDGHGKIIGGAQYDYIAKMAAVGDMDRDGLPDIVTVPGPIMLRNRGGRLFGPSYSFGEFINVETLQLRDLNNDNWPDLLFNQYYGSTTVAFLNLGQGKLASPLHFTVGVGLRSFDAADMDGDGTVDLAMSTPEGITLLSGSCP